MENIHSRPLSAQTNRSNKSWMTQDKKNSSKYFEKSKVESCSKIVIKNGVPMAITYKTKDKLNRPMTYYKFTPKPKPKDKSIYQTDYCTHGEVHLAMNKKPLVPYNPNSFRNRFAISNKATHVWNGSQFDIGNGGMINRKQWVSINKSSYKRPQSSFNANPGILSDMAKRSHYKDNNIEYA